MKRMMRFAILCGMLPMIALSAPDDQVNEIKLKPPIEGLIAMGNIEFHREEGGEARPNLDLNSVSEFPGIFRGIVINLAWNQLEPKQGVLETRLLDEMLGNIREYNEVNVRHPLTARLRIWPGVTAPDWAKQLGGPPVMVYHKDRPVTVGRFWGTSYRNAWRDFQTRLAARYNKESLIREVANTSGSTITDEVTLLSGNEEAIKNMLAAGFSDAQFQDTLLQSPDDYTGWLTTRIECTCNPYRKIDSGRTIPDQEFLIQLMRHWSETLGERAILSNHAFQSPPAKHVTFIYEELRRSGALISFQTHSPNGLDWDASIRLAHEYEAKSLELWSGTRFGGYEKQDPTRLKAWADLFRPKAE